MTVSIQLIRMEVGGQPPQIMKEILWSRSVPNETEFLAIGKDYIQSQFKNAGRGLQPIEGLDSNLDEPSRIAEAARLMVDGRELYRYDLDDLRADNQAADTGLEGVSAKAMAGNLSPRPAIGLEGVRMEAMAGDLVPHQSTALEGLRMKATGGDLASGPGNWAGGPSPSSERPPGTRAHAQVNSGIPPTQVPTTSTAPIEATMVISEPGDTAAIAAKVTFERRFSDRPAEIRDAARSLVKEINAQIEQLASKRNDPDPQIRAQTNDFVVFLEKIAAELDRFADALDQAIDPATNEVKELILLGPAAKMAKVISGDVTEWFTQHHKEVVDYAIKFGFGIAAAKFAGLCGLDLASIISFIESLKH